MRWIALSIVLVLAACGGAGARAGRGGSAKREDKQVTALRAKLQPVDGLFAAGKLDDAMFVLASATGHERAHPVFVEVARPHEAAVRAELDRRIAAKTWGRAYALATLAKAVYRLDRVAETGKAWADELRPAIAEAERARRPATVIVLRAALAAATLDKAEAASLTAAIDALRAERRLAVEVPGTAGNQVRAAVNDHPRFTSTGQRGKDRIVVTLGRATSATNVTHGQSTVRVEQGTRSVPNPAREEIEERIRKAEEEIAYRHEEIEMEQKSPTRSQGAIDTSKYQIEVAQGELAAAKQDLANTPATIEQKNFADVPFDVDTHTLTVSREVTIEVTAPWAGDVARQQKVVTAQRSDNSNAANRGLGVRADPVQLPSPAELEPDLDRAAAAWIQSALDKVSTRYIRDLASRDPKDGAALAIVLAPESSTQADLQALELVPFADRVIHAVPSIARGNTAPFKEAPKAQQAAGVAEPAPIASAKPAPGPSAKPAPGQSTKPGPGQPAKPAAPAMPAQPEAPADPLRAKAGFKWTIAPFDIKRDGRVVASVTASGQLVTKQRKERVVAVFKPGGIVEDPDGKIVLVVGARGDVWGPRDRAAAGTLSGKQLAFARGGTLSLDRTGHVIIASDGKQRVSEAVVPASAPLPIVLVTGWIAAGVFEFRAR